MDAIEATTKIIEAYLSARGMFFEGKTTPENIGHALGELWAVTLRDVQAEIGISVTTAIEKLADTVFPSN